MAEVGLFGLKQCNGSNEARWEGRPYSKHRKAVIEATNHLDIHRLEYVWTKDGLVGAGNIVVRTNRAIFEVAALVEASDERAGH